LLRYTFAALTQDAFTWLAKMDKFVAMLQIAAAQLARFEDVIAAAKTAPNGSHAGCPPSWLARR
jgi:hypothetical protein